MAKVKLNLRNVKAAELADFAENIVTAMTGNPNFTAPNPAPAEPTLAKLSASAAAYDAAFKEADLATKAAKLATAKLLQARKALENDLTDMGKYVELRAKGSEAVILSANMNTTSPPAPAGKLPAIEALSATAGDSEGEVDLSWEPEDGAVSYEVECKLHNDTAVWEKVKTVTASKMTVDGLTPGQLYAFRARGINSAGPGAWSDEAVRRAP